MSKRINYLNKPFPYSYRRIFFTLGAIHISVLFFTELSPVLYRLFALTPIMVIKGGMYWQIFTYQFLHGGIWHLFSNLLGLIFFGSAVERKIGSYEFLLFYLLIATLCGITACILYYLIGWEWVTLIGASGAVIAVLYLFAVLFPDSRIFLFGIFPIPAPLLVVGYACIEVYDMLFTVDSIAHSVHLLGFFFAWLYIRLRFRIKPMQIWQMVD